MTKLAPSSFHGQRMSLGGVVGSLRRAWSLKADRRLPRPLENIDGWSDQAEVAFYEGSRLSRCV